MSINIHTWIIFQYDLPNAFWAAALQLVYLILRSHNISFPPLPWPWNKTQSWGINSIKTIEVPWIRGLVPGPSPPGTGFNPRTVHVRFVVQKGYWDVLVPEYFRLPPLVSFCQCSTPFYSSITEAIYIISNFRRRQTTQTRDFRFSLETRRGPRSSGLLRSV